MKLHDVPIIAKDHKSQPFPSPDSLSFFLEIQKIAADPDNAVAVPGRGVADLVGHKTQDWWT